MNRYDMLYLKSNSNIPFGIITSTARRGAKWFDMVKAGDLLTLRYTEGSEAFGDAVIVKTELVSYDEVIERANENHTGQRQLPVGVTASRALAEELLSAYGKSAAFDRYTMVHFVRLGAPAKSAPSLDPSYAFAAIESEIQYAEKKWGGAGHHHEIASWLTYARDYLREAEHIVSRSDREADALDTIRKFTTLGVRCMMEHGAPQRPGHFVSVHEII